MITTLIHQVADVNIDRFSKLRAETVPLLKWPGHLLP